MPSTYTLNNGIELIGTGEQSGTWGDTTNTNLGLLDAALDGQVTITLGAAGSSGSPNSLPITDGTASNGRNRMVVFADGADLGATAYVQLTPNDAEKIIYIRNSLSGSRSVILFQGTYNASNDYEVPAGTTAVVYFDGAGAGAVAANVFNNAHFDALNVVGAASIGSLVIAGTAVTATAAELNILDGVTATAAELNLLDGSIAGTVVNSKAVIYGAAGQVEATTVEFDNLSGTGAVSVTNILDEDNMASDSATALATQQSIKAYVDAQVDTVDTLAEILAIGNTTGGTDLAVSTGDDITFADSSKAIFGASSDLQIYHDGANSHITDAGTGNLILQATDFVLKSGGTGAYLEAASGVTKLYHSNAQKLATTATGIDVTGTAVTDGLTVAGNLSVDSGTIKLDGNYPVGTNNVALGDGAGANFAAGSNANTAVGYLSLNALTTGDYNTAIGRATLYANTGDNNSALGYNSLTSNTTGASNTGIGYEVLAANTTASNNTGLGYRALLSNTTGALNVAVGSDALLDNTSGASNVAVGREALANNTTASNNTAVGYQAGYNNTTGVSNTSVGKSSLVANVTGNSLTAIGSNALLSNTTSGNTAVGANAAYSNTSGHIDAFGLNAGYSNTTGNYNSAFGQQNGFLAALQNNTTGSSNAAFATGALGNTTTGSSNTGIGVAALYANTTASNNTAVGYQAGYANTTGIQNTLIGSLAGDAQTTASNSTALGYAALGANTTGSNNIAIGGNSLDANTTGSENVAVGGGALGSNTTVQTPQVQETQPLGYKH
jgi:hypothetical protein